MSKKIKRAKITPEDEKWLQKEAEKILGKKVDHTEDYGNGTYDVEAALAKIIKEDEEANKKTRKKAKKKASKK